MINKIQQYIYIGLLLFIGSNIIHMSHAQSKTAVETQSTLASELKLAVEQGGVAAAKNRFSEIYPTQKDKYPYDSQAFMLLITEYINVGDVETAMALGEINATLAQDMIREQMAATSPEMTKLLQQHQQAEAEAKAKKQQVTEQMEQELATTSTNSEQEKTLRTDLDRFTGLYGTESPHRQLWVSKTCDGQLVVGATWGDASPWWMLTASDTAFTYVDNFRSLAIDFKLGPDNLAVELAHDLENLANPLVKTGPLTDEYQACIKPFIR